MNLPWRRRAQRRHKALEGLRRPIQISGIEPRSFDEIRAEWFSIATKARSAVYYVDGSQVGSLSDVRTVLKDGKAHAVYMIVGEDGPELLTGPFGSGDLS